MGSVEKIIEYVSKWRSSNTYTAYSNGTLTEESLLDLLNDINRRIEKLSFDTPEGKTRLILCSGEVAGEYGGVHYAEGLVKFDKPTFTIRKLSFSGMMV